MVSIRRIRESRVSPLVEVGATEPQHAPTPLHEPVRWLRAWAWARTADTCALDETLFPATCGSSCTGGHACERESVCVCVCVIV